MGSYSERLNPHAKSVLDLALREALSDGKNYIGPEHIRAALARHDGSAGGTRLQASLVVPDDFVDDLVLRVASALASGQGASAEPWLDVDSAARHLGYGDNLARGRRRVYDLNSARESNGFPAHKDGSRLLFKASELDAWLASTEQGA